MISKATGAGAAMLVAAFAGIAGCGDATSEPAREQVPHFGYNDDWGSQTDLLDDAAASGADTVRVNLAWPDVEPQRGEYDWSRYDELNQQFRRWGLRPIWVLANAPCWAHSGGDGCETVPAHPPAASHTRDYARFAALVAERYPDARGIEIWNEPNLDRFWIGEAPSPERYAELLVASYDAVKRANPRMPVVSAGLLPAPETQGGKIAYHEFLARTLAAGGAGHFDAVAVHPYPFISEDPVRRVGAILNNTREVLAAAGEGRVPLWVTEVGISTSGPAPVSPQAQSEALVALYEFLKAEPDLPVIVFHRFIDVEGVEGAREAGWGVLTSGEDEKPAFCALAALRGRPC